MSRCSSMVFAVRGLVGLVDEGMTLASPATLMMSGACPPPAPANHGGDAAGDSFFDLLRRDEVNVGIDPARRQNLAFTGYDFGAGADDNVDAVLDVGIAGLADFGDVATLQADIGLDDA